MRPQKSSANPIVDLGPLKFEATLAIEGMAAKEAPSLNKLSATAESVFERFEPKGHLKAKVLVVINSFKSQQTGDVIYSVSVQLVRQVSILGTTEVMDAKVISNEGVGRIGASSAEDFILGQVRELSKTLKEQIEARQEREAEHDGLSTNSVG